MELADWPTGPPGPREARPIGRCRGGGPGCNGQCGASSRVGAGPAAGAGPIGWKPYGGYPSDLQGGDMGRKRSGLSPSQGLQQLSPVSGPYMKLDSVFQSLCGRRLLFLLYVLLSEGHTPDPNINNEWNRVWCVWTCE